MTEETRSPNGQDDLRITEVVLPAGDLPDDMRSLPDDVRSDLEWMVSRAGGEHIETIGRKDWIPTVESFVERLRPSDYQIGRAFIARIGAERVGYAFLGRPVEGTAGICKVSVAVRHRRRGVGRALYERVEAELRALGADTVQAGTDSIDRDSRPRLTAACGVGDIWAGEASAAFSVALGFRLGQVQGLSSLALPVLDAVIEEIGAGMRDGRAYDLVKWEDAVPDEFVEGLARLYTVMSTAAPSGDLQATEQTWDEARLRDGEQRDARVGRRSVTTAAVHRATGELVAFTTLSWEPGRPGTSAGQGYTLVLPEHRGHSLGMWIKIANMSALETLAPDRTEIITGNANDNEAMLRINHMLGFRPAILIGGWEKKLREETGG